MLKTPLNRTAKDNFISSIIPYVNGLFRQDSHNAKAFQQSGANKFNSADFSGAIDDCNQGLKFDSRNPYLYGLRGCCKYFLEDCRGAIEDLDRAVNSKLPNSTKSLLYEARARVRDKLGDCEATISDCDKAIKLGPTRASTFCLRGDAKSFLEDYSSAIADYSKAIELEPECVQAYLARGITKDDDHDAIRDFDIAIELDPENIEAYEYRASAKSRTGDTEGESKDVQMAAELLRQGGDTKYAAEEYDEAIKDYERAVNLDYCAAGCVLLAKAKFTNQDYAGAIDEYDRAIKLDREDPNLYWRRAKAKLWFDDEQGALEDLTQAIKFTDPAYASSPDSMCRTLSSLYVSRGNFKFGRDEFQSAKDDYNRAIELNPLNAEAFLRRGDLNWTMGDPAANEDYFEASNSDGGDDYTKKEIQQRISDYSKALIEAVTAKNGNDNANSS